MDTFSFDDLRQVMSASADSLSADLNVDDDIIDVPFSELGLDSLDVLEIATRVQQDLSLRIPDDAIAAMKTPRDIVSYVNQRLAA